jgi:hypothetical protein
LNTRDSLWRTIFPGQAIIYFILLFRWIHQHSLKKWFFSVKGGLGLPIMEHSNKRMFLLLLKPSLTVHFLVSETKNVFYFSFFVCVQLWKIVGDKDSLCLKLRLIEKLFMWHITFNKTDNSQLFWNLIITAFSVCFRGYYLIEKLNISKSVKST